MAAFIDKSDENEVLGRSFSQENEVFLKNPLESYYKEYEKLQYVFPSSHQIFLGCKFNELNTKVKSSILWQCIIGLTENLIFNKISSINYISLYNKYKEYVYRDLKKELKDEKLIPIDNELKFHLYRHWNIFDSLKHSSRVVSKFKTYTKDGLNELIFNLARKGIRKSELEMNYKEMPENTKELFFEFVRNEDPNQSVFAEIDGLVYSSFTKRIGMDLEVSAADMVYAITSIMEEPIEEEITDSYSWESDDEDDMEDDENSNTSFVKDEAEKSRMEKWNKNFSTVYTILRQSKSSGIEKKRKTKEGIESALKMQYMIVQQANGVLLRKAFQTFGFFFDVHFSSLPEKLQNRLGLTKLGMYLHDILSKSANDRFKKPVVISAEIANGQGKAMIVGIDTMNGNNRLFETLFKKAADRNNINIQFSFDASVIEIKNDDRQSFLRDLRFFYKEYMKEKNKNSQRRELTSSQISELDTSFSFNSTRVSSRKRKREDDNLESEYSPKKQKIED